MRSGTSPVPPLRRPRATPAVPALVTALAAGLLVLALPGAPAGAVTAQDYSATAVRATGAVRRAHDRPVLRHDRCLQRHANRQAARMAAQHRAFHQDVVRVLRACGLRRVGENVAAGFPTGRAVVRRGWMRSPEHRATLLDRRYRLLAVGARRGSDGRWYASQLVARR